ncbi:MAG: hypothetical protein J0M10_08400 [Chitinophagales bacterium]|nr:hypothetical protein [Chitinophagales bacterium]
MKSIITLSAALLLLASCNRKMTPGSDGKDASSTLTLSFENYAGDKTVSMNGENYTNASGETFSVTLLQYFISNISLKKTDGTIITLPQDSSYFLVKESLPASKQITLHVPKGNYTAVTFMLGIDSLRNTKPLSERTGILDPAGGAEGMYWGWNSGYIFFKMEGHSTAIPDNKAGTKKFRYHIGLFGGMNSPTVNNIKNITLDLKEKQVAKTGAGKNPVIRVHTNILQMFTGTENISIAKNPVVMVSPFSKHIADNYASMFSLAAVDNK